MGGQVTNRPPRSRASRVRAAVITGALAAASAGLIAAVAARETADGPGETAAAPLVRVVTAVRRDGYGTARTFLGRIESRREATLGFEVGGRLAAVSVEEGEEVAGGRELARLDTARVEARERTAGAALAAAEATLAEAEAGPRGEEVAAQRAEVARLKATAAMSALTAGRTARMSDRAATTEQASDEARLAAEADRAALAAAAARLDELERGTRPERVAAARAGVERAAADLAAVRVDLAESVLTAPFAGTVGRRHVDPGVVLAAGTPVLDLFETSRPEARVGVAGGAADLFAVGDPARVSVGGRAHDGTVRAVRPDRDARTRTVDVIVALDDGESLRRGDLARLTVPETIPADCVRLPAAALTAARRGLWALYVVEPATDSPPGDATHVARRRVIELLHVDPGADGETVFVRGPLSDGDRVVVDGVDRLVPGLPVRVAEAAETPPP